MLGIGVVLLVGCAGASHHLVHPDRPAPDVVVWSADFARDELAVLPLGLFMQRPLEWGAAGELLLACRRP